MLTFEGDSFTDNGDGTYTPDTAFNAYGTVGAGVKDSSATGVPYEVDGTTSRIMLEVNSPSTANWWGGVTLIDEYQDSDLLGDGSQAITMRVYANQDGNLNLELEDGDPNAGGSAAIVNQTVTEGWNTVTFDFSGVADASATYHKLQLRPDALGLSGEDTKPNDAMYFIDDIHLPQATIVAAPNDPTTDAFLNGGATPTTAEADVIALFSGEYDTDVTRT